MTTHDDPSNLYPEADSDDLRYAPADEAGTAHTFSEAPLETERAAVEPLAAAEDMDIDAALAAVASLQDVLAEKEASEQEELERQEAAAAAEAERQARMKHPELFFPMPPLVNLNRGSLDSVVPALALILIGVWLTFTLTTSGTLPASVLVMLAVSASVILTLLARWLSSGRWARGGLFFALFVLLTGGAAAVLALRPGSDRLWPLMLAAPGVAVMLTALLARPLERRLLLPGLMLVIAGGAGLAYTSGLLPDVLLTTAVAAAPVIAAVVLLLFLLPLIFRRQPG